MDLQQQQMFETDDIENLPLSESSSSTNELDSLFNFSEETSKNDKFRGEIMELVLLAALFAVASSKPVREFVQNQVSKGEETYLSLGVRAAVFAGIYYIIKNTFLK